MTFRQISEIALDGVSADLQMRMKRAVEGSACEALTLRSTAGICGDQPTGGRGLDEPVAFTGRNAPRETGMEKVTGKLGNPAELNREIIEQRAEARWATVSASLNGMLRCMNRVSATGAPPVARFIHLSIVRECVHASPPTIARTSSAAMTSRKPAKK